MRTSRAWVGVLVLAALAVACAGPALPPPSSGRVARKRFQVERGSALWEPARQAAQIWTDLTGELVEVSEDGDIPIFFVSELDPGCESTETTRGCSRITATGEGDFIQIIEGFTEQYRAFLLHEMGHHLRGRRLPGHLSEPGHLMSVPRGADLPTPEDVEFVTEGWYEEQAPNDQRGGVD